MKQENLGVTFIFLGVVLWGAFPVFIHQGGHLPPLTFAAVSILSAATIFLGYTAYKRRFKELFDKKALKYLLGVTLFIVIIPYSLFFLGAGQTSGINVSMLLLAEIIFLLLFTPLFGEKTTKMKLLGALGILIGGVILLYEGSISMNKGDLLIILSTLTYPLGNFYAKKALNKVSSTTTLLFRSLVGGFFILLLATIFEGPLTTTFIQENIWLLLLTGLLLLGLASIFWYEGLKRLDISKAVTIRSISPIVSVLLLLFVFSEPITNQQLIGATIMILGGYFAVKRPSTPQELTKYAREQ